MKPFFTHADCFQFNQVIDGKTFCLSQEHGNAKVQPLLEENERLKEKLEVLNLKASYLNDAYKKNNQHITKLEEFIRQTLSQERTRGYPTGIEWLKIIREARVALGDEK